MLKKYSLITEITMVAGKCHRVHSLENWVSYCCFMAKSNKVKWKMKHIRIWAGRWTSQSNILEFKNGNKNTTRSLHYRSTYCRIHQYDLCQKRVNINLSAVYLTTCIIIIGRSHKCQQVPRNNILSKAVNSIHIF